MCNESYGFKFCTCIDDFETRQKKHKYIWTLQKLVGTKSQINIRGKIVRLTNDLGDGITQEETLKKLAADNCFDFEYLPSENDTLHISTFCEEQRIKYFSLIFKMGLGLLATMFSSQKKRLNKDTLKKQQAKTTANIALRY